jgi:hypothetical protein
MLLKPIDKVNKAGKVPRPKKNMMLAPLIILLLANAQVSVE